MPRPRRGGARLDPGDCDVLTQLAAARAIYGQIREAYQCATCFIQTEPSMPMTSLPRRLPVVPTGIGRVVEFLLQHGLGERPTYGSGPT